jgi:hypothetical protein
MSEGRFISYAEGHYKVYNIISKCILRSWNVIFTKELLPASKLNV